MTPSDITAEQFPTRESAIAKHGNHILLIVVPTDSAQSNEQYQEVNLELREFRDVDECNGRVLRRWFQYVVCEPPGC